MPDKSRVNGWLRHQLVYKVVEGDYEHYVVFSLVIVPGTYGSRVAVYRNGERLGRSLRLGGANALDTALDIVAMSLKATATPEEMLTEGSSFKIYKGTTTLTPGTATLIARV